MKIDTDSPVCFHCGTELETLNHIFLECQKVTPLIVYINKCIEENLYENYIDNNSVFYLTGSHENISINFLWVATKHFIRVSVYNFSTKNIIATWPQKLN